MAQETLIISLLVLVFLAGCDTRTETAAVTPVKVKEETTAWVDRKRLLAADTEPQNWLVAGRDFRQQHYALSKSINAENVDQLGLAWEYPVTYPGRVLHGLEAVPQVIDGVMYTSGPWGMVYALDAKTGRQIWRYDPVVDASYLRRGCCGAVNRGVTVWKGLVYVASFDGYLIALNAKTGIEEWKVDTFIDRKSPYSITGAPQIAGTKVLIGNSGAEFGVRGYISAFDIETGELAWRFYTVPGDPAKGFEHPEMAEAAKTWSPNSLWESGGGGTVWGHMAYDPELNLLYVGTGNGSPWPAWVRSPGGGDNLYLSSILAINPDTGRLVWHYQTTPGDNWDFTATQHMLLAELNINGQHRKVLMQAPKNGFFYVLDRITGELLSANNYVRVNWASHVDMKTGRPVLAEQGNYKDVPKVLLPGPWGGHNWQPMSYNPQTGLVYIPARDTPTLMGPVVSLPPFPKEYADLTKEFKQESMQERLIAWDPIAKKERWGVPLKGFMNGGTLTTAGNLVFQGTSDGRFVAYNATTGDTLKELDIGTGIVAAPMSFMINDEQFIAVMAGYGGVVSGAFHHDTAPYRYQNLGRIIVFKLGGSDVPLPPPIVARSAPESPPLRGTSAQYEEGRSLFKIHCWRCHGGTEKEISAYPNLMMMSEGIHQLFDKIVLDGLFSAGGMASFSDVLNEKNVEDIHVYLIHEQGKINGDP